MTAVFSAIGSYLFLIRNAEYLDLTMAYHPLLSRNRKSAILQGVNRILGADDDTLGFQSGSSCFEQTLGIAQVTLQWACFAFL